MFVKCKYLVLDGKVIESREIETAHMFITVQFQRSKRNLGNVIILEWKEKYYWKFHQFSVNPNF